MRSKRYYIKVLRRNPGAGYIGRTIYGHAQGDRRTSDEEPDGYGCRMVSINDTKYADALVPHFLTDTISVRKQYGFVAS